MRNLLLLSATFLVLLSNNAKAQLVGGNGFLQGQWLEIGVQTNGALGAEAPPAGYHGHCGGCWPYTGVSGVGEVYDYGHDGWAVGTPAYMGDYTLPGSPFEGWEVQMNGGRAQMYQSGSGGTAFTGGGTLTGAGVTTYSNTGGTIIVNWSGTYNYGGSSLLINQEYRVDTEASWVVMTTKMYNTSASAIPGVYYLRTCDPDNDETWPGGSFTTTNIVDYQNDSHHRVLVEATGQTGTFSRWGLGTKDCRAVAFVYNSWPLTISQDLGAIWTETYGPADYTVGTLDVGDIGIGLVYNIGTIGIGDSAVVSYAYIFGVNTTTTLIDSAFPDPVLSLGGSLIYSFPDTISGCSYPGVDSLPINIAFGNDKNWSWATWTWSPSLGLASTTGVSNYILLNRIPGNITYTVTGTDSSVGMLSCHNSQIIFTVHSCHFATTDTPCEGGAITLGAIGDSIGATYFWWGPPGSGWTAYVHDPVIFPATMADTGIYYVVRTIGGFTDTDFIHVMVHPTPSLTVSSSLGLCDSLTSIVTLNASLDSTGETFSWTGPFGFTATGELPAVSPFDSAVQGTYYVTGTSVWGCTATGSTNLYAGTEPHYTYSINYGCTFDTVYFYDQSLNASSYAWQFGDTTRGAMHIFPATSSYVDTITLTTSNAHCTNSWDTIVDRRHSVTASFWPTPDTVCLGDTIVMTNNSTTTLGSVTGNVSCNCYTVSSYWDYGNGASDTVNNPSYQYDACGLDTVTLTVTDSIGCTSTAKEPVYIIQLSVSSFTDTTLCISQPLPMSNIVTVCPAGFSDTVQYTWTQSTPNLSDTSVRNPTLSGFGTFVDTLSISYPIVPGAGGTYGCTIRDTVTVHAVLGAVLTDVTASSTIAFGGSVMLNADNEVIYYWTPDNGSLSNPNINDPIATPSVTTTYTVYGLDVNGCLDSANVIVYVDSTTEGDIPSGFTPNGDHLNDIFRVVGPKYDKMVDFRVFNRWGNMVFYTNDKNQGWDGTFQGVPQDMGVYNYVITVATAGGENIIYKGTVTLIR